MSKKAEMLIEIEVDDNGSRKIKKFGDNVATTSKKGSQGFGRMDKSLGGLMSTTSAALPVLGLFAAGVGVGTTAISAMVIQAAAAQREIKTLATLANTSVADLMAYSYATKQVGITMESLADISKDVQDKLGDFLATGGGEFADFFENVAPKVGLTAEALQGLSGPDVLVALKKALDDANVSAEEQVFYLESIANDAARLTPLLEDNGRALYEKADAARDLGVAISDVDSTNLTAAAAASTKFGVAFEGLYNRVAARLAPMVTATMDATAEAIGRVNEALDYNQSDLGGLEGELQLVKETLYYSKEGIAYKKARITELNREIDAIKLQQEVEANLQRVQKEGFTDNWSPYLTPKLDSSGVDKDLESFFGGFDKYGSSLDSYFSAGAGSKAVKNAAKEQGEEYIDAWQHTYNHRYEIQSRALQAGIEADEEYLASLAENFDEMENKSLSTAEAMEDAFTGWASNMSTDLNEVMWGADLSFENIAESFGKMITQMIIQTQIIQPMLDGLFNSGGLGGIISSIFGGGNTGAAVGAVQLPTGAIINPSGAAFGMAGGGIIAEHVVGVGLSSGRSYEFGEGGVPEAVLPQKHWGKGGGGGVINNITIINNSDATARQKESPNSTGGMDIEVMIDKIVSGKMSSPGSSIAKTMRAQTGASRIITRR